MAFVFLVGFAVTAQADDKSVAQNVPVPSPRLPRDNLLVFRGANNQVLPVRSIEDWLKRRSEIVAGMQAVMGKLPGREKRCPLNTKIQEDVDCGSYMRRLVTYESEPGSRVPAYLLVPKAVLAGDGKQAPAVLCLHGTDNVVGHGVVVGIGDKPNRQYARELAERGYVTLAPNYPLLAKYQPDLKKLGWDSGTLKAVWDNIRGLDLLESLPFVKKDGFGAIGHSLGGHNTVYTSVFDSRIKVAVSSCGLDSYLDYYGGDEKRWMPGKGWTQTLYMPRLAGYRGHLQDIPFDFHELIGALAPRHVLIIAPKQDHNFQAKSVDRIATAARPVFKLYGHPARLKVEHPDGGHDFPPKMRETAYKLFDKVLRSPQPVSRILFGSCTKQDRPMPIFKMIVAQQPELFVFLGDNIYADTADMDVMRAKYAKLKNNAGFAKLMKTCPILATWDDHDYGVNDGGADYPKKVESQRVFVNFWRDPPNSPRRKRPGVYDAKVFGPKGKRLQVILLDTRYFRGPLKKGERRVGGPYLPSNDKSITMLGEDQWKWLEEQLRVPAEVRIIASSIQCVSEASGQETWSNLPHERRRLFDLIDKTEANGVFFISGDRHWAELSVASDATAYPIYDLTSSSFNQIHPRGTPTENKYRALPKTFHKENFGTITIDWEQPDPQIRLQVSDIDGKTQIEKKLKLSQLQRKPDKVQSVIDEVDKLCREETVYMIGPTKAKRLAELVRKKKPKIVVECGTAIGYSGLWIARELRAAGRGKLITIEIDVDRAKQAQANFEKAGLADFVEVRVGDARKLTSKIKESVDFLFIDCNYSNYDPCFRGIEKRLAPGAVVVADNVGIGAAGMKDYLDRVRSKYRSKTEWFDIDLPWGKRDAMEVTFIEQKGNQ
jgi:predicted O-methyltransferase YrrM/dienelactone hydrolase